MSIDHETAAAALYGTAATRHEPEPHADRPAGETPGARLQDQMATAEKQADKLFNHPADRLDLDGRDTVHASTERVIEEAGVGRLGLEPEQARESAREWSKVWREFNLSSAESAQLVEIGLPVLTGAVQPDTLAWANEARGALTSEYGAGADQALADARALVAKHPGLARMLDATGLGSHPAVVTRVAREARSLRKAGRL